MGLLRKCRTYLIHLNLRSQYNLEPATLKVIGDCKNLQDLNLSECNGLTDTVMKRLTEGTGDGLLYLNLSSTSISDMGLKEIGQNCPGLRYLSLSHCSRFTDRGIHALAMGKVARKLQHLNVSSCPQISLQGYHSIAKGFQKLEHLILTRNYTLTDPAIIIITQKLLELKTLQLEHCSNISDQSLKYLSECRHLETLYFEENHRITDAAVKVFSKFCSNVSKIHFIDCIRLTDITLKAISSLPITHLNIADCNRLSDSGIRFITENAIQSKLKELDLTNLSRITDISLFRLRNLPCLKKLTLAYCENLTEAGMEQLDSLNSLTHIDLTGTGITDESLSRLGRIQNLTSISISECNEITDHGLTKFANRVKDKITSLDISHCKEITDKPIKSLAFCCRALQSLNFTGCWRLTDLSISYLTATCPNISTFDISGCYYMTDGSLKHFLKLKKLQLLIMKFCRNITANGYHMISEHVAEVFYDHDDAPKWFGYHKIECLANMVAGSIKPKSTRRKSAKPGAAKQRWKSLGKEFNEQSSRSKSPKEGRSRERMTLDVDKDSDVSEQTKSEIEEEKERALKNWFSCQRQLVI